MLINLRGMGNTITFSLLPKPLPKSRSSTRLKQTRRQIESHPHHRRRRSNAPMAGATSICPLRFLRKITPRPVPVHRCSRTGASMAGANTIRVRFPRTIALCRAHRQMQTNNLADQLITSRRSMRAIHARRQTITLQSTHRARGRKRAIEFHRLFPPLHPVQQTIPFVVLRVFASCI